MRIGEVARQAGVSVRALRYYEEQRLLGPTRTGGGQREYQDGSVERVRMIQQLYAAGLSSRLVREVLPRCMNEGDAPHGFTDNLITERARIDRQINDLTEVRARLDEIIAVATDPDHPDHCHPIRAGVAASTA
ncbi:MerR family transcriptional regulator [Streptomyces scabiei]|uniref:MerR family transcriptional regulator n=1 Tax=Streptomyces TaxID=1883 RepID=UPI00298EE85F|nr:MULTISPECIES: MerR family transcriptional regulator [Streptomyces]MDW8471527.1 MerR family transcriptional regulator [Streptomyces scabiei]MDX2571648.1 MerR family transcriptional regulator [Streptomyces scabiei]MDX3148334.1 MerR family transcriptional regulator [Streptomyces scabiei]MDX3157392.1 MerR family transcriptional regulator [Streptomyces scabiei]MDX3256659.1 MerR family transcriptional regulator [Streptomyces scabiei]